MLLSALVVACHSPLTIISTESKTASGEEIFNTIEFKQTNNQDIWSMKQSHGYKAYQDNLYDDLEIIVDKKTSPYTVSYYQKGGFKVQCTLCHSNGPRMIRPTEGYSSSLSFQNRLKIAYWNLIIKSYGNTQTLDTTNELQFKGPDQDSLNIKTCNKCHNEGNSFLSRNRLQRGNSLTIKHLTESNAMPPWPYSLTKEEKLKLKKFLMGF